jgi:two-component system LytT family sensor kinase
VNFTGAISYAYRDSERVHSRFLTAFIILFWIVQFVMLTAQRLIATSGDDLSFLLPRTLVTLVGIAISFAIERTLRRLFGRPLPAKLAATIGLALLASLLHSVVNFATFQAFMGQRNWDDTTVRTYFAALIGWFWNYSAVAGVLLALSYSREVGQLQRVAHNAQLRALRYQLNPHFMFNTLNSIVALVSRREVVTAERMVEDLAEFLRATLMLDPEQDIELEREIGLQSLYLEIERLRFGERLTVELDIPPETARALVPSLIVQPLAENVVRHAVANSSGPVRFSVRARRQGSRLCLTVHNSEPDGAASAPGSTGVGLANVADRLQARYGANHGFSAGGAPEGGFTVRIDIPFVTARGR